MKWIINILLLAVILVPFQGVSAAQTLVIGTADWKPWQIVEEGSLVGITSEILQELSRRTGYKMDVKTLPHKRLMLEFERQQIDMEPTVSQSWREEQRDISVYTRPYYETSDVILVRKGSGIAGTVAQDFKGMSLGCGLGYYYPEGFQAAFESGMIIRDDNPVSEFNILKLAQERLDGIIVDRIQAGYMIKVFKLNAEDFEIAYVFRPSKLSLRLHKNKQDLLPMLNRALESMKADGTIKRIVTRYLQ
jgi:ABC-type amino acid transport substrate-binding protein